MTGLDKHRNIRSEYPRPQFERKEWLTLNGNWQFDFDDYEVGSQQKWYQVDKKLTQNIKVPFVFQSELSGINDPSYHDYIWYKRNFVIPKKWSKEKIMIHFGAVDYHAWVFINGQFVGEHVGGHTAFSFEISDYLKLGENQITVKVFDPSEDEKIPRGKQYWQEKPAAIWYTRTTGIWQTVWIEPLSDEAFLSDVRFTSDFDRGMVEIEYKLSGDYIGKRIRTNISFDGQVLMEDFHTIYDSTILKSFYLFNKEANRSDFHGQGWTWTPDTPNLFDVEIEILRDNVSLDLVNTYFGLRKVHIQDGMIHLNNRPFYQKLILDQGYWPNSLMTAPTDEDFIKDIRLAKEMGFNGCRKHQKIEDPRFLYWADKLGFIVWGECASPSVYSEEGVSSLMNEWYEIIRRDYNHPCILTWVPINESWGVPEISQNRQQQHFSQAIYHMIHSLDTTRLVISNDGWEMTETDICAVHSYIHGESHEKEKYEYFVESIRTRENIINSEPNRRKIYCPGFTDLGVPIMLTEFGGIGFNKKSQGWGYTSVSSEVDFLNEYRRIIEAVYNSESINGFCYTQLTDVEQEKNGLLTSNRHAKVETAKIREINNQWHSTITKKK